MLKWRFPWQAEAEQILWTSKTPHCRTLFLISFFNHLCVPYRKFHSLLEGIRINKREHFQSGLINVLFHSEGGLNNSAEECSIVSRHPELPDGCTQGRVWPGPAQGALLLGDWLGLLPGFLFAESA